MRARVLALLAVAAACAAAEPEVVPVPVQPLGTSHTAPAGTGLPDTRPPVLTEAPFEARELAAAVAALGDHGHRDHGRLATSFARLADVLTLAAPEQTIEVDTVRRIGEALERSPRNSSSHADYVKLGLEAAARALASITPRYSPRASEYPEALRILVRAIDEIDPATPLLRQHPEAVEAFEAMMVVVFLALGAPLPGD